MSRLWLVFGGLIFIASSVLGCEVRPKPVQQAVEYRSGLACVPTPQVCPWANLDRQARFAALVNCLLAGATALQTEESRTADSSELSIVAPVEPRYGYEHATDLGAERTCPTHETVCQVSSRHERGVTWATCGTESMKDVPLRGGSGVAHAERLTESVVVSGRLTEATNEFRPPHGLNGPDHFYSFTLSEKTRMESAVAANTSYWSNVAGLVHSPWQPALYLLSADGTAIKQGQVFRAGITSFLPANLQPGTYYLVVDSSLGEWSRGDGSYRLYVGFNENLMGTLVPSP